MEEAGKPRRTHGGSEPLEAQRAQQIFKEKIIPRENPEAFNTLNSRELGASRAVLGVMADLGLARILYSRKAAWVQSCLAMIAGCLV